MFEFPCFSMTDTDSKPNSAVSQPRAKDSCVMIKVSKAIVRHGVLVIGS